MYFRDSLLADKGNLKVAFRSSDGESLDSTPILTGGQNVVSRVSVNIQNRGSAVEFMSCKHFCYDSSRTVKLSDSKKVSTGCSWTIPPGGRLIVARFLSMNFLELALIQQLLWQPYRSGIGLKEVNSGELMALNMLAALCFTSTNTYNSKLVN